MSTGLAVKEAIWEFLSTDSTLVSMLHDSDSIYERNGPQEAVFPFVVYFKSSGEPQWAFGPNSHCDEEMWTIKAIDRADSSFKATQIADHIDFIMHDAELSISGNSLLYCRRDSDVDYAETEPGNTIHHVGAIYLLYREEL